MKTFANAFEGAPRDSRSRLTPHAVKFYESDAQLVEAVRVFVHEALRAGDGVVLVATSAHQSAVLSASGVAARGGPIVVLSAQETLDELMPGGVLSRECFRRVVGVALERASRSATGNVRAFGEMVDLLAREGRTEDALRLEEMWNELLSETGVSLLCGYALSSFPHAADAAVFRAVCDSHSHVAPAVGCDGVDAAAARHIAALEQQALGVKSEIEARKQLTARLDQSESALVEAQRLGAIALQTARIAGELNNLLTTIVWGTDSLLEEDSEGERKQAALEIRRAARAAGTLTRRLQALGSHGVQAADSVDANDVAFTLHTFFKPIANPHYRFDLELCPEATLVAIDYGLLEQITLTLIINARAGIGSGGRLVLRTRHHDVSEVADGGLTLPRGRYIEITATVDGAAPGSTSLGRMFEPFLTNAAGSIGLSTVYQAVQKHGGTILVERCERQGSTFRVLLPSASSGPSPLRARQKSVSHAPGGRRLQVFVADEEPLIRRFIARSFRAWGYDVVEAEDGATAIALGAMLPHVDLFVTDVSMPRVDGSAAAAELFQLHPGLVVIFVTGQQTDEVDHCVIPTSRRTLIAKPFDTAPLHEAAVALVERNTLDRN